MTNKIRFNVGDEVYHYDPANFKYVKKYVSVHLMQDEYRYYYLTCEKHTDDNVEYSKCYVSDVLTKEEFYSLKKENKIYTILDHSNYSEDGYNEWYSICYEYLGYSDRACTAGTLDDALSKVRELIKLDKEKYGIESILKE